MSLLSIEIDFPYASKILFQEFMGMNMCPKIFVDNNGVKTISFCMLTPEEWKAYCADRYIDTPYTKSTIYTKGTINDPRQGTIVEKVKCPTCGMIGSACQNHFMYVPLEIPVYNKQFIKETVHFLNCVCIKCGALRKKESLIAPRLIEVSKKERLMRAKNLLTKVSHCEECSASLTQYNYDKKDLKKMRIFEKGGERVSPWDVYNCFKKIKNRVCDLLGMISKSYPDEVLNTTIKPDITFFRPEAMMFLNFPVLPISCRPWIESAGVRNNDDLTDMYNQVVKINHKLKNITDAKNKKTAEQLHDELQIAVNFIILAKDMQKNKMTKKKKGITDRIGGKSGHIIDNVTGKRCNFTSRVVITTGGSTIPFGWLGMPADKSDMLYKPEVVTSWNRDRCKELLETDKVRYVKRDGITRRSKYLPANYGLNNGDVIYRKLEDGDLINTNRQPTIRLESIQSMRVKRIEGFASRLPPSTTRAFNADYDGDEMNQSVPQSVLATVEMLVLGSASNIVTPQSNTALMSCIQNVVTFFYYITKEFGEESIKIPMGLFMDVLSGPFFTDHKDFFQRAKEVHGYDRFFKRGGNKNFVPGKVVASAIFPRDFVWEVYTGVCERNPVVKIEKGILKPDSGPICKKIIGQGNSAIQYIWKFYSPTEAGLLINRASALAYPILRYLGFSIGISDSIVISNTLLKNTIRDCILEAEKIRLTEKDPDLREVRVREALNSAMSIVPKMAATQLNKGDMNAYTIMKVSGTKGNDTNTGMMAAFLAQQNIDGKRPRSVLTGGTRTTIHTLPGDDSPYAKGFVKNSFLTGLTLIESIMQAHAGRRGVIDTAAKTSTSGYSQKKMGKKTEDCVISAEKSVSNFQGVIYNFLYGDDGMNPKELIKIKELPFPFFFDPVTEAKRLSAGLPKKPLSKETIAKFCSYVKLVSPEFKSPITDVSNKNLSEVLGYLLGKTLLAPEKINEFAQSFIMQFNKSQITYGSAIGMVSCLSVGEIVIQLTMDTHRNAGGVSADVTSGLPRLKECIEATKNPSSKNMTFSLLKAPTQDEASYLCQRLEETMLGSLIKKKKLRVSRALKKSELPYIGTIYRYNYPVEEIWWVEKYCSLMEVDLSEFSCPWFLEYDLDLKKLYAKKITLWEICEKIEKDSFDPLTERILIKAIPSPLCIGKIAVFINQETIGEKLSKRKSEIPEYMTPENRSYYYVRDSIDSFVRDVLVTGIPGIKRVYADFKNPNKPVFTTKGSNLLEAMMVENIDLTTLSSNDFWEMADVYGFEVGKACLLAEIEKSIASSGNSSLNRRHTQVLVDSMCRTGVFTSANRHGIKDTSIISQMMFETGVEVARLSSMYNKSDNMNSIPSCVLAGKGARIGNQLVEVV